MLSTDALNNSVSSDRASAWVSRTLFDPGHERGRDVVARFALLRLEQLGGEAAQVPDGVAHVAHHRRVAGERLQRDPRPVGELGPATHVAADHPAEDRRRDPRRDVGHELATAGTVHVVEQIADQIGGAGTEHFDPSGREPGHDDAPEVLVVAAFRPEQGARALDRGSVGTGAAHHLEDAGTKRGVEQQPVAALVGEHPEARRRAHDPRLRAHRAQLAVGIGRERIGGVVEERQLTRRYRHAAAAYRSP